MPGQFTMIIGGARSGKSTHALRLAARYPQVLFVATAEPRDGEMAAKIARHRAERPAHWRTIEAPLAPALALALAPPAPVVLLDCVTLWVSNMLLAAGTGWPEAEAELAALLAWQRGSPADLIVVTNEVGWGIVPADALTRSYREWLGWFNQRLAAAADHVDIMVAGLPLAIKPPARHG